MVDQIEESMMAKVKKAFRQMSRSYKRMLLLAKPEWQLLAWGTFFLAVGSGLALIAPQMVRVIVDGAKEKGFDSINHAALWMILIFVLQGVAVGLRFYLFTHAGQRIVSVLRAETYKKIMEQDIGFFDERKTGELMSRLSADTQVLQSTVTVNVSMVLRNLAMVVGATGFLVYTSPILATLMLIVVPPIVICSLLMTRPLRRQSRQVQDALARASEVAAETIAGVRTVRAFAREDRETERYGASIHTSFLAMRARARLLAYFQAGLTIAGYASVALVLWYGGHLVIEGSMTVGSLTSFIIYTFLLAFSLSALGSLFADFVSAAGAAERLFSLLDSAPEQGLGGGKRLDNVVGTITFDAVTFKYPTRPEASALDEVSFTIRPGEVVALVGPSGSGKSTIAALISRFYDPSSGTITLDGVPLGELDPTWLRKRIGVVSQEPILFSTTLAENIGYGADAFSQQDLRDCAEAANATEFIDLLENGLETQVGERGVRLSGGQKQRVAIARALLKNPEILILDEATSALDAASEFLVKQALDRLMKGRTSIVIAHRLSTVRDADRVLVMDKGRLVEEGTHQELLSLENGLYRKLIERQFLEVPDPFSDETELLSRAQV